MVLLPAPCGCAEAIAAAPRGRSSGAAVRPDVSAPGSVSGLSTLTTHPYCHGTRTNGGVPCARTAGVPCYVAACLAVGRTRPARRANGKPLRLRASRPLARSTAQARRHLSKLTREDGQHKRRKKSTRHVQEKTTPLSKPQLRSPGNGAFIRRRVTATETLSQRHKGHGARPLSPEPYSDSAVRAHDKAGCCVLLWRR
jgi:hypothetical protein